MSLKMTFKVMLAPRTISKMTTISELQPGARARVSRIGGSGAIRQRLLDMGLLPKAAFTVQRIAPAGDPIWIKLDDFQISLRRSEAATVFVALLD